MSLHGSRVILNYPSVNFHGHLAAQNRMGEKMECGCLQIQTRNIDERKHIYLRKFGKVDGF
jgi:hypothetical protein